MCEHREVLLEVSAEVLQSGPAVLQLNWFPGGQLSTRTPLQGGLTPWLELIPFVLLPNLALEGAVPCTGHRPHRLLALMASSCLRGTRANLGLPLPENII